MFLNGINPGDYDDVLKTIKAIERQSKNNEVRGGALYAGSSRVGTFFMNAWNKIKGWYGNNAKKLKPITDILVNAGTNAANNAINKGVNYVNQKTGSDTVKQLANVIGDMANGAVSDVANQIQGKENKAVHAHEVQAHRELVNVSEEYELSNEETRLRFTNQRYEMPAPVVVYADFESAIDDRNKHKPIMLSCLAVSRIPAIDTQLRVFHAPHESEEDLRPFMEYLTQLQSRVKTYLFDELPLESTSKVEKDFRATTVCPFCHVKLEDDKVRHHAHVAGEYTTGKGRICSFKAGQYICTCCTKCNLQLSFNKKNYRSPVYFHNGSHYDFTFIMKLIATMPGNLEVIPTTEDKEMQIEYNGIQFKDSLKLISSPLRFIVAQTLGGNLDLYVHTKQQLCKYCESRGKQWNDEYIDLLTRKEPMFYSLIKSYDTLNNTVIPSREQCIDDMKGEMMPQNEYDHMVKLWKTFDIKTWGEYYELYNVLDVTLMADAFEHFRVTTLKAFGVDPMHSITAQHHKWPIRSS